MSRELHELSVDDFERALLSSAQQDTSEPDVQAAWNRFALLAGGVALSVEAVSGVHRLQDPTPTQPGADSSGASLTNERALGATGTGARGANATIVNLSNTSNLARSLLPLKWAASGAILAALFTSGLFWVVGSGATSGGASIAATVEPVALPSSAKAGAQLIALTHTPPVHAPRKSPASTSSPSTGSVSSTEVTTASAGDSTPHSQHDERIRKASRVPVASTTRTPEPSRLAAEVRLVDGARRALRGGSPAQALSWIERYRSDFPSGALSADVAYLELAALNAHGRDTEMRQAAQQFLLTHPRDPHAAQVTRLLAPSSMPRTPEPETP